MRISVITVTWNSSATLRDTMQSVLNQSYSDVEHIIIDGASTDGTMDIVREMEPLYKGRLRYVSEHDNGLYDAMNKGIGMATGHIVGILNSDDFFTDNAVLATIARQFEADTNLDAVYGDIHFVKDPDLKNACVITRRGCFTAAGCAWASCRLIPVFTADARCTKSLAATTRATK